jgi:hypothetical protein
MHYLKQISFAIIFFFCCNGLWAQEYDSTSVTLPPEVVDTTIFPAEKAYEDEAEAADEELVYDTTLNHETSQKFPADSIIAYKKQKAFSYISNLDSMLKAIQEQEAKRKPRKPSKPLNIFPVLKMILWVLAIAVIIFIIYRLFLGQGGLFAAPLRNKKLQVEEEEQIDVNDIERQLSDAISKGNFRLATRYLYLQTLSRLAGRGLIQLSPDKTNYQYVKEFQKHEYKNEFARVTMHYEYVWYGDFHITNEVFTSVKNDFDILLKKIK